MRPFLPVAGRRSPVPVGAASATVQLASTSMRILLVNGPNLNLLGTRSPEVYGSTTLPELEQMCRSWAEDLGHQLEAYQSNHEGALIDAIQGARSSFDAIVLNGGAFTHYSYAIHDAIESVDIPTVEVHISNIRDREEWRAHSVTEPATVYQIFGRGIDGYHAAIRHLHHLALSPPILRGDGSHPDRIGDLRLPSSDGPHSVVVLLHGGFWRQQYTRDTLDSLAIDLVDRGFATWNAEYRRVPPMGAWRTTMNDAADAVDAISALADEFPLDPERITVLGHSAGAHLAYFAARDCALTPQRVVMLGGVLDIDVIDPGHDALPAFLGDELDTHRDVVNPTRQVPLGIPMTVVHGGNDDSVASAQSINFADAAKKAGDEVTHLELPHSDHWDIIDARSDAWKRIVDLI